MLATNRIVTVLFFLLPFSVGCENSIDRAESENSSNQTEGEKSIDQTEGEDSLKVFADSFAVTDVFSNAKMSIKKSKCTIVIDCPVLEVLETDFGNLRVELNLPSGESIQSKSKGKMSPQTNQLIWKDAGDLKSACKLRFIPTVSYKNEDISSHQFEIEISAEMLRDVTEKFETVDCPITYPKN